MLNNSLAASNPKDRDFNNSLVASNTKDRVFYSSILSKIWLSPLKISGLLLGTGEYVEIVSRLRNFHLACLLQNILISNEVCKWCSQPLHFPPPPGNAGLSSPQNFTIQPLQTP